MKTCLLLLLLATFAQAAEIRWTARGTMDSVTGTGFPATGIAAGSDVALEMSYDSGATLKDLSRFNIGSAIYGKARFINQIDLKIKVRIGPHMWSGALPATGTFLGVIETECYDFGGSLDKLKVILNEAGGGTFPSFPYSGGQTGRELSVEISDTTSLAELFWVHVLPQTTTDTSHVTAAKGSIKVGTDLITITFNPPTVRVSGPPVRSTIAKAAPGIEIIWDSEAGKNYRIEESGDLSIWQRISSHAGTGSPVAVPLNPFVDHPERRFYQVFEE